MNLWLLNLLCLFFVNKNFHSISLDPVPLYNEYDAPQENYVIYRHMSL